MAKTAKRMWSVALVLVLSLSLLSGMVRAYTPTWSLSTLDGGTVTQNTYRDKLQLLVFFRATMNGNTAKCPNSSGLIRSLAQSSWITDSRLKVVAIAADGSGDTAAFKNTYAPNCTDIVFALDGSSLMWNILRNSGGGGSVTFACCAILKNGEVMECWDGCYSSADCKQRLDVYLGADDSPAPVAGGECGGEGSGSNLTWVLDDRGTLTISGVGLMANFAFMYYSPFYENAGIKKAIIQGGVTSIGVYTFEQCTGLTEIVIPESVTLIGAGAFSGCTSLRKVCYCGSEEQWKAIEIEDNLNDCLSRAGVQYNYRPVLYAGLADGAVRWQLAARTYTGAGMVLAAAYDADGRMLQCKMTAVSDLLSGASGTSSLSTRAGGTYKVFLLNAQHKPLGSVWAGRT